MRKDLCGVAADDRGAATGRAAVDVVGKVAKGVVAKHEAVGQAKGVRPEVEPAARGAAAFRAVAGDGKIGARKPIGGKGAPAGAASPEHRIALERGVGQGDRVGGGEPAAVGAVAGGCVVDHGARGACDRGRRDTPARRPVPAGAVALDPRADVQIDALGGAQRAA